MSKYIDKIEYINNCTKWYCCYYQQSLNCEYCKECYLYHKNYEENGYL